MKIPGLIISGDATKESLIQMPEQESPEMPDSRDSST
jgi:hypothetical protein